MNTTPAGQVGPAIKALYPRQMGALPLLYPILNDLQVRQTVNELAPTEADIDLGRIVVLLTLNRLLAPQPLYQVQDWLAETVLPEVLGIPPEQAYDNRLGRALDRLCPHLGELWARLAARAVQVYDLDLNVLHWDITSIYFEGAYTDSELVYLWPQPGSSPRHQAGKPGVGRQSRWLRAGLVSGAAGQHG